MMTAAVEAAMDKDLHKIIQTVFGSLSWIQHRLFITGSVQQLKIKKHKADETFCPRTATASGCCSSSKSQLADADPNTR